MQGIGKSGTNRWADFTLSGPIRGPTHRAGRKCKTAYPKISFTGKKTTAGSIAGNSRFNRAVVGIAPRF
jgi:hypothetical protein